MLIVQILLAALLVLVWMGFKGLKRVALATLAQEDARGDRLENKLEEIRGVMQEVRDEIAQLAVDGTR